jgi:hypothetical protein
MEPTAAAPQTEVETTAVIIDTWPTQLADHADWPDPTDHLLLHDPRAVLPSQY